MNRFMGLMQQRSFGNRSNQWSVWGKNPTKSNLKCLTIIQSPACMIAYSFQTDSKLKWKENNVKEATVIGEKNKNKQITSDERKECRKWKRTTNKQQQQQQQEQKVKEKNKPNENRNHYVVTENVEAKKKQTPIQPINGGKRKENSQTMNFTRPFVVILLKETPSTSL